MIEGLFNHGSMPALERVVQFTAARHKFIANSIANVSTPNFQPTDLSVDSFQKALAQAIDRRRSDTATLNEPLKMNDTSELHFTPDSIVPNATPSHENIMFHDRNDRSIEHLMKSLAENAMTHNASLQMLKNQYSLLETAIRERV